MNEQKPPNAIEWTRIRNADGSVRRGFTWNPIAGCLHDCKWDMPSGDRAQCYAKTVAEKFSAAYPEGFEHYYYHSRRLDEPKRISEGAGIFPDSMSDLFGRWVQYAHLSAVLNVMQDTKQHIYQCLTKNAPGYIADGVEKLLPPNLWAGVSSPPDHMWGNDLDMRQKEAFLHRSLRILSTLREWRSLTTWMSFEPLSQDWANIVAQYPNALSWAVIGAASNGSHYYPPDEAHVRNLLDVLDANGVAVFFKGNLKSLSWAAQHWREDFPVLEANHAV